MGRTLAGMLGFLTWLLSLLFAMDAYTVVFSGVLPASAVVAAVLWCGGLVIMLLSGILSEGVETTKLLKEIRSPPGS